MDNSEVKTTNRLLKALLAATIRNNPEKSILKDQISFLSEIGLRPVEIAEILGKTPTHVNKELAGIRKSKKA